MEEQTVKTDAGEPRVSPGPAPAYDKADFQQSINIYTATRAKTAVSFGYRVPPRLPFGWLSIAAKCYIR